jgi:formate dehydrogenase maturation protein FdhE
MLTALPGVSSRRTEPVKRCPFCGREPRATVQAGGGKTLFWLECRACGTKTSDDQVFEQAVRQWNAMQPGGSRTLS